MATTEGYQSGTSVGQDERQRQRGAEAFESVKEHAAEARTRMADAKEKIADAYERTSDAAGRFYRDALDCSRGRPGTAMLVAFGAGVGLGVLLSDGRRESRYRRNVVPAIATAMAEAVLDIFDPRR